MDSNRLESENDRIQADEQDLINLQEEIAQIRRIKAEHSSQRGQIEKLSNAVNELRDQNDKLKKEGACEPKAAEEYSRGQQAEQSNIYASVNTHQKTHENPNKHQNLHYGAHQHAINHQKIYHKGQEESHRQPREYDIHDGAHESAHVEQYSVQREPYTHLNLNRTNIGRLSSHQQMYAVPSRPVYPASRMDTHAKSSMISGFVEELTLQLQKYEITLKRERQISQEIRLELKRTLADKAEIKDSYLQAEQLWHAFERENQLMRSQLQDETLARKRLEEELRRKSVLLQRYENIFMRSCSAYEEELTKMDCIYDKIHRAYQA